jgi:DNA polymerase III subunit delta'
MKRPFGRNAQADAPPESDRLEGFLHPRATHALYGHAGAEAELLGLFRAGKLPQAIIIGGPEGIGKATLAWRFARFLANYPDPAAPAVQSAADLASPPGSPASSRVAAMAYSDISLLRREWDSDKKKHFTEIKAEHARAATHVFQRSAGEGGWRICIVDCAEDLNAHSANSLLKIIEEPPARSLFLILAHRPAAVLATIRSRCRRLNLSPLGEADIAAAVKAAGEGVAERSQTEIAEAARAAGGSVRKALRRLSVKGGASIDGLWRTLDGLPQIDWDTAHRIAEDAGRAGGGGEFQRFVETTLDWLHARSQRAGASAARLAPYAEVWDKLRRAAREAEAYNLDKKPLVLLTFADIAEAARRAGAA